METVLKAIRSPLLCLLIMFCAFLAGCDSLQRNNPSAHNGVLDLSFWDFVDDGHVELSGQWEFYWHQLLFPSDFADPSAIDVKSFVSLPGLWAGEEIEGRKVSINGYATYRLNVELPPIEVPLAIEISDIMSAHRLWVNGRLRSEDGALAIQEDLESQGRLQLLLVPLSEAELAGSTLEIVLQVSNFNHLSGGGYYQPLTLGRASTLTRGWDLERGFLILFIGIMMFMGFFHLVFFFARPQDRSPLYFSLFCLFWVVAIGCGAAHRWLFFFFFPHLSFLTACQVELIGYYCSIPFGVLFFQSIYPDESSPIIGKTHLFIAIILSGLFFVDIVPLAINYILTMAFIGLFFRYKITVYSWNIMLIPAIILAGLFILKFLFPSNGLINFYVGHVVSLVAIGLIFIILIKAWIKRLQSANLLLGGGIVLIICGLGDILTQFGVIKTVYLTPGGLLFLACCQSCVLALRFSSALNSTESLSSELQEKNISLAKFNILKDEFFANTSHEIRTPLSGIIGITESMIAGATGTLPKAAVQNLQMVVASSQRLTTLVNDILDFSRLKNTDISLNLKPVDLRTLLDSVCAVLQTLANAKGLLLVNSMEDSLPPVYGDEDRLQQIFYNLIGNSIKFTNKGSVTVSGSLHSNQLEVLVTDTGVGIPQDKLEDIFLSYKQVDSTASREFGGTGLGLYITKRLVELHQGEINVSSECDRGTTFSLHLPVADPLTENENQKLGLMGSQEKSFSALLPVKSPEIIALAVRPFLKDSPTILVVDDDPVNLQVAVNQLSIAGYNVSTASDGYTALTYCDKNLPDLLLLDIMMPGMTGYQVCSQLREIYSISRLPVIMLTAKNGISDLVCSFEAGANDYLTKPFSREELLARVQAQLQVKNAYATLRENSRLKKEITERQKTEHHLQLKQRRLSRILDSVDDSIIAINENEEITFCNQSSLDLLCFEPENLLGSPACSIFAKSTQDDLRTALEQCTFEPEEVILQEGLLLGRNDTTIQRQIVITSLEFDDEHLCVLIIRNVASAETGETAEVSHMPSLQLIAELSRNQLRLRSLEETLNAKLPELVENPAALQQEIKAIDTALSTMNQSLLYNTNQEDRRELAVTVMTTCVEYWSEATELSKVDMASESGLWNVYTNKDGWERTQTLDKYLDLATLPLKPRWNLVISTADFVLTYCEKTCYLRNYLESNQIKLRFSCQDKRNPKN